MLEPNSIIYPITNRYILRNRLSNKLYNSLNNLGFKIYKLGSLNEFCNNLYKL